MDEQNTREKGGAPAEARESRASNMELLRQWDTAEPHLTSEEASKRFKNLGMNVGPGTVRRVQIGDESVSVTKCYAWFVTGVLRVTNPLVKIWRNTSQGGLPRGIDPTAPASWWVCDGGTTDPHSFGVATDAARST